MKFFISVLLCVCLSSIGSINSSEINDIKNLIGQFQKENKLSSVPCNCDTNNGLHSRLSQARHKYLQNPASSMPFRPLPRMSDIDPEERQRRINESMARFMQILTFFGHVDNFLTQKTHGLIKIMGKAVESDEDDEDFQPRRRYRKIVRTNTPRIITTVTS